MDRVLAYSLMARKLEEYRSAGYEILSQSAGGPPTEEMLQAEGEPIVVAVRVLRTRDDACGIIVEVTVYGQHGIWNDRVSDRIKIEPPSKRDPAENPGDASALPRS
jgi:hypothetical protein